MYANQQTNPPNSLKRPTEWNGHQNHILCSSSQLFLFHGTTRQFFTMNSLRNAFSCLKYAHRQLGFFFIISALLSEYTHTNISNQTLKFKLIFPKTKYNQWNNIKRRKQKPHTLFERRKKKEKKTKKKPSQRRWQRRPAHAQIRDKIPNTLNAEKKRNDERKKRREKKKKEKEKKTIRIINVGKQ